VDIDLSYFSMIYPCGMRGIKMTSLAEILGVDIDLNMAAEKLIVCAKRVLGVGDGIFAGTPLGAAA
jgi:lipoate-protein ligase B